MGIDLRLLSSLDKVFPDEAPAEALSGIPLSGFMNEPLAFQAAWRSDEGIDRLRLIVRSPIEGCLRVRRVMYVPVRFAAHADADDNYLRKTPGLYPDLLREAPPMWRARAGQWECAWIDVEPDEATEPGRWPIDISLVDARGDVVARRQTEVEILPLRLPEPTLTVTRWFHCDGICHAYGVEMFSDAFFDIAERFIRLAAKRGMNMILTPTHTPPLDTAEGGERMTCQLVDIEVSGGEYRFGFEKLDRWVAMCQRAGIEGFEIAHLFTQWGARHAPKIVARTENGLQRIFGWETDARDPAYARFLRAYLTALTDHLRALGIADRCRFHISDEPQERMLEDYRAAKAIVADALKGFPIMDALSSYAFYETGAVDHPIPAIDHIEPFVEGGVKDLWTYYCVGQYRDVSNMFMAMPSARNRILGVQLYKYDIQGFLHWGYNFYNSQYSLYPVQPYLITDGDGFSPAGDCFQVYPGADGVPEESIRLVVTHEAFCDLRALRLLESLRGRDFVVQLIDEGLDAPVTFKRYPRDAAYLLGLRERVNREIIAAAAK